MVTIVTNPNKEATFMRFIWQKKEHDYIHKHTLIDIFEQSTIVCVTREWHILPTLSSIVYTKRDVNCHPLWCKRRLKNLQKQL